MSFFREFPLSERCPTKRGYNICVVSTIAFAIIANKKVASIGIIIFTSADECGVLDITFYGNRNSFHFFTITAMKHNVTQ